MTDEYLTDLLAKSDANGDGKISLEEYKNVIKELKKESDKAPKDQVQTLFDQSDNDPKDAAISEAEFLVAWKKFVPGVSDDDSAKIVNKIFKESDKDSNNSLNSEEFAGSLELAKKEYDASKVSDITLLFKVLD